MQLRARINRLQRMSAASLCVASVAIMTVVPLWHAAGRAHAQAPSTGQPALDATALFEEAQHLMVGAHYAEACARYQQSQQLDPQLGTLLHLADCQEKLGKTATAHRNFIAAAELAARRRTTGQADPREQVAQRRAERLKPTLAQLRIVLADPQLPGLRVTRDGELIEVTTAGTYQPVDPGKHNIVVEAPDHQTWSHSIPVEPATRTELAVPRLSPSEVALAPAPVAVAQLNDPPAPKSDVTPGAGAAHTQRLVAYGVGGAAVVGMGVALYFGLRSSHFLSERKSACRSSDSCSVGDSETYQRAQSADRRARSNAAAFNWTGALSLAALAGGVVLYLTDSDSEAPPQRVTVSAGWGSLSVRGAL